MSFYDTMQALNLAGYTFDKDDPREMAIMEWLQEEDTNKNIKRLNDILAWFYEMAGYSKDYIIHNTFTELPKEV